MFNCQHATFEFTEAVQCNTEGPVSFVNTRNNRG
jgi:hypothetical protein